MGMKVGILHPGQMGISIAASAVNSGNEVFWSSEGRSIETRKRAKSQSLIEMDSLFELCQTCSIIFSVCPPHAAVELANNVVNVGYKGLYIDANAISPNKVKEINQIIENNGAEFVDGSIIGGPAWKEGTTWMYLSGPNADKAAECFSSGPLGTKVIGDEIGRASAVKMCFAAYTKGTSALLCAILAAAERLDVREVLEAQWTSRESDFAPKTQDRVRRVTAKAWRFAGEMEEIADTFDSVGIPNGFHLASGEIYRRISQFKGWETLPPLGEVLDALGNIDS